MDKSEIYEVLNQAYFSDDPHERAVIENIGRVANHARVVVDAGASLGQYTRALSQLPGVRVAHAIEADPIRVEELSRNAEQWERETGTKISVHHAALSDADSDDLPYFVTNSDISGGLKPHPTHRDVEWEAVPVPGRTLDSLLGLDLPDFVKVDVEGAEMRVLRGATRILNEGTAVFLIELHHWDETRPDDVPALMGEHGYLPPVRFYEQHVFVKDRATWLRLKLLELGKAGPRARRARARLRIG